jgi:hypothetical protein
VSAVQSEASVVALGPRIVAAWNDGGLSDGAPSGLGYGYSHDGGRTWTDGAAPPKTGGVGLWISDPVLALDEKRALFYLAGMVIAGGSSGVAVVRGAFHGDRFIWETPRLARTTRDTFPDKPWIAVDSLTGNLYLSYTTFLRLDGRNSDQIEFQRSTDLGQTWTPAVKLSLFDENGLVQGSRPVVGPDGELHLVWKAIDTTLVSRGRDPLRIRTSRDGGASFGERRTVSEVFTNFSSGPPGFNRGWGLGFPSVAVDRSTGSRRGRLYVAWEEALNFFDDPLGTAGEVVEAEPDDSPALASPFVLGQAVEGSISSSRNMDWYRFHGLQGQTVIVQLELPPKTGPDVALRLLCDDARTRLAYSAPLTIRSRVLVFTLPKDGAYFVTVDPLNDSTGAYRLKTGVAQRGSERGRDHRDIFVSHSDDGTSWSPPARVDAAEPRFDDWLPELAVAPDGKVYVSWFDWREGDPEGCGAAAHVRLARSDDGGEAWSALGPVTQVPTLWTTVGGNLVPNLGDYHGLFTDSRAVYPCWGDGRDGDPNVYLAAWPLAAVAHQVESIGNEILPDGVRVAWRIADALPLAAAVYRRSQAGDWEQLATVRSDAAGLMSFVDRDLEPGWRYRYRLGVQSAEGEIPVAEIVVDAPVVGLTGLMIERVLPNPSAGEFQIWFRRQSHDPARLELLDPAGRRVRVRELGNDDGLRGSWSVGSTSSLKPGLYLVRLSQSGRMASAKAIVIR